MYRKEIRLSGSVVEDSEEIGKKLKRKDSEKQGETGDFAPSYRIKREGCYKAEEEEKNFY
jgi:hypothetical protein